MKTVRTDSAEYMFDAWIATACMPSGLLLQLLEHYLEPAAVYDALQRKDAQLSEMIPPRFFRVLQQNASDDTMADLKKMMERHAIGVIRIGNRGYPARLTHIPEPPAILFYQGDLSSLDRRNLAIVGSRAASYMGQKATIQIAEKLSRCGITIISGLACGIDAAAHQGCIAGGSPTIAVTGCGLDRVYPADNFSLRDRILNEGGILLSEYAPGEKPDGWHFPVRNRIVVGIANALILMEARIRSGSMTSVQHALDQGKEVFVYPGDPASEQFEGNHRLLREGGIFFTDADDILEDMGWLDNPSAVRQNSDCSTESKMLSVHERLITEALKPGTLCFEDLLRRTALEPSVLLSSLTILQIRGIIEALPGKQYQLKH